jgi:calcium binding protein 39
LFVFSFCSYNEADIALNSGTIVREVIRLESLCEAVLTNSALFNPFFDYVKLSTFDIASDAFTTFRVCFYPLLPYSLSAFFLSSFER